MAKELVTQEHDQCNKNDTAVCNYFKVADSQILTTSNHIVNGFNGYIINSSEALHQNEMDYSMNLAKTFYIPAEVLLLHILN